MQIRRMRQAASAGESISWEADPHSRPALRHWCHKERGEVVGWISAVVQDARGRSYTTFRAARRFWRAHVPVAGGRFAISPPLRMAAAKRFVEMRGL